MKHCPTCGSSYTDDTLVYCLQDGATLQSSSERRNPLSMIATLHDDTPTAEATAEKFNSSSAPTVEIPASALPTTLYGESRPTARATSDSAPTAQAPSNTGRVIAVTVAVTVLLLAIGSVGAWMLFRGQGNGRGAGEQSNSNAAVPAASANEANTPNAGQGNGQGRGEDRADKGGRWFVILASFQKDEAGRATERMNILRRQGLDARVASSNDYPNFKSDLWLVLMGPYTRNRAEEVLAEVRPKVKDAYTKSGW